MKYSLSILLLCFCSLPPLVWPSEGGNPFYPQQCGSLNISYPFQIQGTHYGIEEFTLLCKPKPELGEGNFPFLNTSTGEYQVLNINTSTLLINMTDLKAHSCNVSDFGNAFFSLLPTFNYSPSSVPFTISGANVFASVGCYVNGSFFSQTPQSNKTNVGGSCAASCLNITDPEYCNGFGCCQTTFIENWRKVNLTANLYATPRESGVCAFSTILDPNTFSLTKESDKGVLGAGIYGLRIDWAIGNKSCSAANQTGSLVCASNAHCRNVTGMSGYVCECNDGYAGDGYVDGTRCNDIDECASPELNNCYPPPLGKCTNLPGNFSCSCAKGKGDGISICMPEPSIVAPLLIGIFSTLVGAPLITAGVFWAMKKRRKALLRKKYFEQNGGLILQEYLSSDRGRRKATIFTEKELEKATDNFSENLKVGVGGFGYVYRGSLAEGRPVAIKKCKEVDQEQINQFINEVIILSQIDHRNVVKLLGCCLETEVPLLVYEYVSNGTLYDHLYSKDGIFLSWTKRLDITIETAEAIAYLHSAASVPIVHRDIKSANILLDSACVPKLSDFGLSRLMPTENSHLTTAVKGTLGYLDPQYFLTVQLTDKTDVYSFGVVMVEMLTSMKPLALSRAKEERNLTTMFLSKKAKGLVADTFDVRLVNKADSDDVECMTSYANLAESCLDMDADARPSMKELVQELLWIRAKRNRGDHPWLPRVSDGNFKSHSNNNNDEKESGEATPILIGSRERSPEQDKEKHVKFLVSATSIHSSEMNTLPCIDIESLHSLAGGR